MTGFLGLRIFIDRSQRITLHDMSPSLLDLHLNEFADVVVFVGTKALILDLANLSARLWYQNLSKRAELRFF